MVVLFVLFVVEIAARRLAFVRSILMALGRFFFVVKHGIGLRRATSGSGGRILAVTAAPASASAPSPAAILVKILCGHGFFQRLTIVWFGDGRGFNRVDDLVDVFAFISWFAGKLATFIARSSLVASAAASAPSPTSATAPWLVFLAPIGFLFAAGGKFSRCLLSPIQVVLCQHKVIDKIGRNHLVGQQFFGRRFIQTVPLGSFGGTLATALVAPPFAAAAFATPAMLVPAAVTSATLAGTILTARRPRRSFHRSSIVCCDRLMRGNRWGGFGRLRWRRRRGFWRALGHIDSQHRSHIVPIALGAFHRRCGRGTFSRGWGRYHWRRLGRPRRCVDPELFHQ